VVQNRRVTTLFLIVGFPGAGKPTRAKELAADHRALRLTPDDWMITLFGESNPDSKRDVLEGRLISVALQHYQIAQEPAEDSWARCSQRDVLYREIVWVRSRPRGGVRC
jgi:AAA domain